MTEPTQAAKQRACDLANAAAVHCTRWEPKDIDKYGSMTALAQLCQDISDGLEAGQLPFAHFTQAEDWRHRMSHFILLKPAHDPLAEALADADSETRAAILAPRLRAALALRGYEVAPIKPTTPA